MRRRFLWIVLLVAVLAALGIYSVGSVLIAPAHASIPEPPADIESVSISSRNGTIHGWWARSQGARGTMLLLHGVRGNRTQMLGRLRLAQDLQLDALAIDMQAHGESEGGAITFGYRESFDAIAAVEFLKARTDLPVFVLGVSMGGAAAILADPALDVRGMVLEAVYPDIGSAISNRLAMRIPLGEYATPLFSIQILPRLGIRPADLSPTEAGEADCRAGSGSQRVRGRAYDRGGCPGALRCIRGAKAAPHH